MKKVLFLIAICALIFGMYSCADTDSQQIHTQFEENDVVDSSIEVVDNLDQVIAKIDDATSLSKDEVATRSSTVYYYPSPNGGQCGKTSYLFLLKDYGNDPQRAVRLKLPKGNTIYLNLYRWNDYQYIYVTMYNCGDVFWSMVNKTTQQPLIGTYKLKNTGVSVATNGISKLGWPYKNDGSSWANKAGWWEAFGSQYHTGVDAYAQDWNWGSGNDDLGKEVTAPLCGKVISAGWIGNCLGNTVDIVHYTGTEKVMHRVSHLDQVDVSLGQWVQRGQLIGELGYSGSSTCSGASWTAHTHCVMYELDANESVVEGLEYNYSY